MKHKKTFREYLEQLHFSEGTIRKYMYDWERFNQEYHNVESLSYKDIIGYMEILSNNKLSPYTKQLKLSAIKKYYDYLLEEGIREDHPCRNLNIKSFQRTGVVFSDLFTSKELEELMEIEETFPHLKTKNQLITSFLIYQGLMPQEIMKLKIRHADLDSGSIYITGGKVNTSRRLELHPKQYRIIDKYLSETRKRLLQVSKTETDYLILNYHGKPTKIDDIQRIAERARPLFPDRNLTTKSIRDSVIANLLNEKKLQVEQVQLFAGHRWISSTLRYRQNSVNDQRDILNKYHPLQLT